jgi:sporulation protein YlmC with PRC-barrel domain
MKTVKKVVGGVLVALFAASVGLAATDPVRTTEDRPGTPRSVNEPAATGERPVFMGDSAREPAAGEYRDLADVRPLERATELIGKEIRVQGADVNGTVKDLVLDDGMKRIDHLAVSFRGHEDYRRVDFGDLKTTADGEALVFEGNINELRPLPGFERATYPEGEMPHRVTDLIGMAVRGKADDQVGTVHDLLIGADDGAIREATVAVTAGFLGIGRKVASVDWDRVQQPEAIGTEAGKYIHIDMTEEELKGLAYSESEYWQRLGFGGTPPDVEGRRQEDFDTDRRVLDSMDNMDRPSSY